MTELRPCPKCGICSPPQRYERPVGFHKFRVECPHYAVSGWTRESVDRVWNRIMGAESRRLEKGLARKERKRDRREGKAWRPVYPEPLPCPICGNPPTVRSIPSCWHLKYGGCDRCCHCRTCNYDTQSAPTEAMAIGRWNEYVLRNSPKKEGSERSN